MSRWNNLSRLNWLNRGQIERSSILVSCCLTCWKYYALVWLISENMIEVSDFSEMMALLFFIFVGWSRCDSYAHGLQIRWGEKCEISCALRRWRNELWSINCFWKEKVIRTLSLEVNSGCNDFLSLSHRSRISNLFWILIDLLYLSALYNLDTVGIKDKVFIVGLFSGDLFDFLESTNIHSQSSV